MNNLKVTKRSDISSGQLKKLRIDGSIPAILYGGTKNNINLSVKKSILKNIIKTDSFMSKVVDLDIDGNLEKVLPKEVSYDALSDEPIHIDFIRIVKGSKLELEIPVKFTNSDKSPGLKKGGVLNIVRRKVKLKCPAENIPEEIVVNLDNTEIGTSIKISAVKLPENITPVITERDFVIATIAAPSIIIEPEKVAETTAEGETVEGEEAAKPEGEKEKPDDKEKSVKSTDEKVKPTKSTDEKSKSPTKETGKKK